jgi:putative transposase
MDDSHLWAGLRYVELNPVRAGMASAPDQWRWSSAAAHCHTDVADEMLEIERWQTRWTVAAWREYLAAEESPTDLNSLRQCTHTGRPLGTSEFVAALEQTTLRRLAPRKG